jgi:hypothetical protein
MAFLEYRSQKNDIKKNNKMKKSLSALIVTTLLITIFISCSKDDDTSNDSPIKDYSESIKDRTWWGVLTYTGKTAEYYSVHFSADNTLIWSQLSGDYAGTWVFDNKSVVVKFGGSSSEIKAEISNDDKFISISDNSPSYEINNGQLIASPNIPLNNTLWKGTIVSGGAISSLQLKFLPDTKVEFILNNTNYGLFNYSRSPFGGAFRFDSGGGFYYFGVFISATQTKGSGNSSDFPFQLNKQ